MYIFRCRWCGWCLLLALLCATGVAEAQEDLEYDLRPYAATVPELRRAVLAAAGKDFTKAARMVQGVDELPAASRDYLEARYLLLAGKTRKARKKLEKIAGGDSALAPVAALQLGEMALASKQKQDALEYFEAASAHQVWCSSAHQGMVDSHLLLGDREAAATAFQAALECTPDLAVRRAAVLARGQSLGVEQQCRLRLLHQSWFERGSHDSVTDQVKGHWGDEFSDLVLLRKLLRGGKSSYRRARSKLDVRKDAYAVAMYDGLIAKQLRRKKKAAALPHFKRAQQVASSDLREAIAIYYTARTMESLDRDLEARDLYAEILRRRPDFPLARALGKRIAQISLREGQPLVAIAALTNFLGSACPGEDLSEALHLAAFVSYLSGNWEEAAAQWGRLARSHFFSNQSPWVFWGPLALFWQAKAELAAGNSESAMEQMELLNRVFPGDYYGVLSGYRLGQQGVEVPGIEPARLDVSPLTVSTHAELPADYGGVVELFKLGLWDEAHKGARRLAGLGIIGPATGDLMLSSFLRSKSIGNAVSYRRATGMLPAPWRQGARMWRSSLPLDYAEAILHGHDSSGLDPALTAAIIRFESNFNPVSHSRAGAIGLLQVKRNTGNNVAVPCLGEREVSRRDLEEPMRNLQLGSIYIRELIHRHHDNWAVALAAYNAGPGTASWWLSRFAGLNSDTFVEQITYPNTVGYLKRILGVTPMYWSLYYPLLGAEPVAPELPLNVPDNVRPFLDESGGRCPGAKEDS
jgi:soluble lytic murein transglycosylase-like protein/predicted negative regulator of RcsB-dependent stress response